MKKEEKEDKPLPEWVELFGELRDEADVACPDGGARILVTTFYPGSPSAYALRRARP